MNNVEQLCHIDVILEIFKLIKIKKQSLKNIH